MKLWIGMALAASLLAGMASAQAPRITRPEWASRPNGDQLYGALSHSARNDDIAGWTVLKCFVDEKGRLRDCRVIAEGPANYDFGKSGLKLMTFFRLKPATKDGVAIPGGTILIPIAFASSKGAPTMSYAPGKPSFLLKPIRAKSGVTVIPCPTVSDKSAQCQPVPIFWAETPPLEETAPIILAGGQSTGVSTLTCEFAAGKPPRDCVLEGEQSPAVLSVVGKTLAKLKDPRTLDSAPVTEGRLAIIYDWTTLTITAKAVIEAEDKAP